MKRLLLTLIVALPSLFFLLYLPSCQKMQNPDDNLNNINTARLQVRLHDSPGDYEAVLIDVKDVLINFSNDSTSGWQSLPNVKTGTYDLLELANGKDTLLVDARIQPGRIHQIRLVLGSENFVQIEGEPNPIKMQTPSAQQSGLKLNIQMDVEAGFDYVISLDFEAARSIVKTGNGKYLLKPVIRTTLNPITVGGIQGIVMPDSVQTTVYALMGTDTTSSSFTDSTGAYSFSGLPVGMYSLYYLPSDPTYKDSTRTNISVMSNRVTVVDTTFLHQ